MGMPEGARDNGLVRAGDFAPVAILPEHLVEEILTATADADLPAYVVAVGESPGFSLQFQQFSGPGARLFVLRADVELARQLLADFTATSAKSPPPVAAPVDDDTWAGLVAAFEASPDADSRRGGTPIEPVRATTADDVDDGWADITARIEPESDDEPVYAEDLDHYVPPPPPPLPETDAVGKAAWAGVLGVPVLLVLAVVLDWELAGWMTVGLVLAFLGGFGTLLWRMGDRVPVDDGPDDGAVV